MSSLVLYNYFRSSTSFRVRIAMHLKGLDFEYRPVSLLKNEQHTPEYRKINPMGGVPTLIHEGRIIPDSTAILEYLEDIAPTPALLPKDFYLRARVRQICQIVNSSMHPYGNLKILKYLEQTHSYDQVQKDLWAQHWTSQGLDALEKTLAEFSGKYCFGDEVTLADIYVYPQMITCQRFNMDLTKYPTLWKIYQNCKLTPAFDKAHPRNQVDIPEELKGKI